MNAAELSSTLEHFTGSQRWFRHQIVRKFIYTEGAQHFFENAGGGAYWFSDIVATELTALNQQHYLIGVTLTVSEASQAIITATDGNNKVIYTNHVGFTDCPQGEWNFFLSWDGTYSVFMLRREY